MHCLKLSGFEIDMPHKYIGLMPYIIEKFKYILSLADAWGDFL